MKSIDLNCDMGESYGSNKVGNDNAVMPWISSCNIACGFHGGDPVTIRRTIKLALRYNVAIGAHPSYPDREGFGRREMNISGDDLYASLVYQISALKGMTEVQGKKLHHVKPHGALYNKASVDLETAEIITTAIADIDKNLLLYGPANNEWEKIANKYGISYIHEVFSDRGYNNDHTLVNRQFAGAVIGDLEEKIERSLTFVKAGVVKSVMGEKLPIKAQTICIHGDHEGADDLAENLHNAMISQGFIIKAPI